jgi:hypothetical protein
MAEYRTIRLPEDLCVDAEKSVGRRFESLEALVGFLLREIVKNDASKLDRAEEQMLQERLRDLGYL